MNYKDIKDYETSYQVSATGIVKSKNRFIATLSGSSRFIKGKILKPKKHSDGYYFVTLCSNGKRKNHYVHRLVAIAYLDNPDGKPQVNHKNGKKTDNNVTNLEWVTIAENTIHAYQHGLSTNKGASHSNARKLIDHCTGKEYHSIQDASINLDINYHSLRNMLSGSNKNKTCLEYCN